MTVTSLWQDEATVAIADGVAPASGAVAELLLTAVHCNNATLTRTDDGAWSRSGDPSESALLLAAAQLGIDVAAIQAGRDARRRRLFAFNARLKRMATLDSEAGSQPQINAKGAPLELLERCTSLRAADGSERPLDADGAAAVRTAFERYAADGLRVFGFAARPAPDASEQRADDRDVAESGLCFLGLTAMRDPLRAQVPAAVADCHCAYLLADQLELQRDLYYGIYMAAVAWLFVAWARDTGQPLREMLARRWRLALALGIVFAGASAAIALSNDGTSHPGGVQYAGAILWRGILYGTADGLLLSAFPILVVFAALRDSKLRQHRRGVIAVGALAMLASLTITATYHLGYSDFRSSKLRKPVAGDLIWSVPTLATLNPIGAPMAHVGLHVAAVTHSYHTDLFLPPHR